MNVASFLKGGGGRLIRKILISQKKGAISQTIKILTSVFLCVGGMGGGRGVVVWEIRDA